LEQESVVMTHEARINLDGANEYLDVCYWRDGLCYSWYVSLSTICQTSRLTSCVSAATKYGWDIHVWDLPITKLAASRQVSIAGQTLFLGASGLTKLSMLVSYERIAASRTFLLAIRISMVICSLWIVVFTIVLWTQCM
jgi:hypothetical protein